MAAAGCAGIGPPKPGAPAHHRERGFANTNPAYARPAFWTVQAFLLRRVWAAVTGTTPTLALPVAANDGRTLRDNRAAPTLTWVGHSTFLVQLDGLNVLTDPQWSERASPLSFAGPRRLTPPGLAFADLPPVDVVVISHDHYDHLDRATVERLAREHRPRFLVPLGLKAWLADLGITAVDELDWWESRTVGGVTFTCLPVQHWSARTPWDTDHRLWAGWGLAGRERRLFFAGDTGYYDGLREIGARLGPFDVAAVPIGTYAPPAMMRLTHTTPEQALDVAADVRARRLVAMHWGTFDLSEEPPEEPPARLRAEVRRRGVDPDRVWIFKHGETRPW